MSETVIRLMQERIAALRRMLDMSHDPRINEIILKMIAQKEQDIIRLEAGEPPAGESIIFDAHPAMRAPESN
jgi:hypothetical protein